VKASYLAEIGVCFFNSLWLKEGWCCCLRSNLLPILTAVHSRRRLCFLEPVEIAHLDFVRFLFSTPDVRISVIVAPAEVISGVQTPKSNHASLEAKQCAGVQTTTKTVNEI
jgi:hypothetical protein